MRGEQSASFRALLIASAQYPGDRLMYPRVYLQVTNVLRCKAQLYAAIGAYVGGLGITGGVLHSDSHKPLARRPLAYLAFILH